MKRKKINFELEIIREAIENEVDPSFIQNEIWKIENEETRNKYQLEFMKKRYKKEYFE